MKVSKDGPFSSAPGSTEGVVRKISDYIQGYVRLEVVPMADSGKELSSRGHRFIISEKVAINC